MQANDRRSVASEPAWRIGELSAATGLTARTFHHYDSIGLLVPSRRSSGGHRLYSAEDVRRLSMIVILRRAGVALAEIRELLDSEAVDIHDVIRQQTHDLQSMLMDTIAFGRRLREEPGDAVITEPQRIREVVSWVPRHRITVQPIMLLVYADVETAYRRLIDMFGFGPGDLARRADGTVGYAEITGPTGNIRLHAPRPGLQPPDPDADPSSMITVGVADIDAHLAGARRGGATIVRDLSTLFGMREYLALDHEHHLWCFQQPA